MSNFYNPQNAKCKPINNGYKKIKDPGHLYELLSELWCEQSCAPRLRHLWSPENKTVGQCSITAFLTQDIFGGEVYGVLLEDGAFHCFNVIDDVEFDLTSEQFDKPLTYTRQYKQDRNTHFSKEEKKKRYEYLKNALLDRIK